MTQPYTTRTAINISHASWKEDHGEHDGEWAHDTVIGLPISKLISAMLPDMIMTGRQISITFHCYYGRAIPVAFAWVSPALRRYLMRLCYFSPCYRLLGACHCMKHVNHGSSALSMLKFDARWHGMSHDIALPFWIKALFPSKLTFRLS